MSEEQERKLPPNHGPYVMNQKQRMREERIRVRENINEPAESERNGEQKVVGVLS